MPRPARTSMTDTNGDNHRLAMRALGPTTLTGNLRHSEPPHVAAGVTAVTWGGSLWRRFPVSVVGPSARMAKRWLSPFVSVIDVLAGRGITDPTAGQSAVTGGLDQTLD